MPNFEEFHPKGLRVPQNMRLQAALEARLDGALQYSPIFKRTEESCAASFSKGCTFRSSLSNFFLSLRTHSLTKLVGGIPTPLIHINQLGWLLPKYGEIKMFQTTQRVRLLEATASGLHNSGRSKLPDLASTCIRNDFLYQCPIHL